MRRLLTVACGPLLFAAAFVLVAVAVWGAPCRSEVPAFYFYGLKIVGCGPVFAQTLPPHRVQK